MTTTINNEHKELNFSSEREQSQACLNSAEHEKNQGRKVLNVPNKREQNQTCLDSAEREGLRPKGNVPNLRFPEFKGEWEKCILGDITENFNLRNKDKIQYPMFSVTNDRGFVPQSEQFEGRDMVGEDIKAYKIIHTNDFAYNPARINVGSIAMYTGEKPCMISSLYVCFKTTKEVNNEWLMQLLKTPKMNYYYNINGEGGVRVYLFYPNFARIRMSIPKIEEQKKIAKLLNLIDERIATQNKIIDKLQSLIKGISSRIFASIQGIEYRMGDIVTITNGNSNVQDAVTQSKDGLYPFFDRSEDIKYLPTFLFDKEAIIYPGEGTEFMPRYFKGKFALHQRCYAIFDFNEIINARFLYFYLKTRNSYFVKNAVGSTVPSLRLDTFQKLKVIIPSKKIQHSVSLCLSSMEQKCNVEKKILHKLLKQKQYLLRQMFI